MHARIRARPAIKLRFVDLFKTEDYFKYSRTETVRTVYLTYAGLDRFQLSILCKQIEDSAEGFLLVQESYVFAFKNPKQEFT